MDTRQTLSQSLGRCRHSACVCGVAILLAETKQEAGPWSSERAEGLPGKQSQAWSPPGWAEAAGQETGPVSLKPSLFMVPCIHRLVVDRF